MKLCKLVKSLTLFILAMIAIALPTSYSFENKSSAEKAEVIYEIKQGDTLLALVAKYFANDTALAEIIRINQIKNPYKIPIGQKITFPRDLLAYSPSQARLTTLDCADPVILTGENKALRLGDIIVQGASIKVPRGCVAGMTLEDSSVVSLLPGTLIHIKYLRKTLLEKSPEVELELLGGRIELDVPKRLPGDAPYQVRTPSSLAGVRGTKFSVGFDADQHNSQVEVNHGDVAARGNADAVSRSVQDNMGVAISASGEAGEVESLPAAPLYDRFERDPSTSKLKLKFKVVNPDVRYKLSTSDHANFTSRRDHDVLVSPEVEIAKLTTKATFYQWASLTKSGLIGPLKQYGFCVSNDPKKNKCNVNFDMRGHKSVAIQLQRFNQEISTFEDVINSTFTTTKNDQLLFRDLPAGRYQWNVDYTIDSGINIHKTGDFDLVVILNK
jgi:hypothetical protein